MIEIDKLAFQYPGGAFSLNVEKLCIAAGETVAVVGPSGTGKTTLLNLMSGCHVPQQGTIRVNSVEISALQKNQRAAFRIQHIGLVFQEFELIPYLNVLDNLLVPYRITPALVLNRTVRDRAAAISGELGIADKLRRNVSQLSQGERQRVAIARALLPGPPLLLGDEPTGNLDPDNKKQVLALLFDQVAASGTTLVVVTHDHELLSEFDRVVDFRELLKKRYSDSGEVSP